MPRAVQASIGMLFTPAPARAIAFTEEPISDSASLWLRSRMASGVPISLATS